MQSMDLIYIHAPYHSTNNHVGTFISFLLIHLNKIINVVIKALKNH